MKVVEKMDAGPILDSEKVSVEKEIRRWSLSGCFD